MKRYQIEHRGSQATEVLEQVWENLRKIIDGLPSVVIVILSRPGSSLKNGHFVASNWKYRKEQRVHEIAVNPYLFERYKDLLATLLHEAVHAYLYENDSDNEKHIAGCGQGGYYHRKEYRDTAIKFGLICEFKDTRHGWNITHWLDDKKIPKRYRPLLQFLKRSMPWGTGTRQWQLRFKGKDVPKSGHIKLVCKCFPCRNIYVKRSLIKKGGIWCKLCKAEFQPEENPKQSYQIDKIK